MDKPWTVAACVQYTADLILPLSRQAEQIDPRLVLFRGPKVEGYQLRAGQVSKDLMAMSLRSVVLVEDPDVAVLSVEGWGTRPETPEGRIKDLLDGKIHLGDMPAHERMEVLLILGEGRDGTTAHQHYEIGPGRTHTQIDSHEMVPIASRFLPLFLPNKEERDELRPLGRLFLSANGIDLKASRKQFAREQQRKG